MTMAATKDAADRPARAGHGAAARRRGGCCWSMSARTAGG